MPIPRRRKGEPSQRHHRHLRQLQPLCAARQPGVRTEALYDTLFTTSDDEPGSYYPLIAEHTRYADDFSWMEIALNPRARFHDGSPITASDVAFTFHKFMTEGVPQFRLF
jgi:microcin C transport system substrate-binding protein